MKNGGQLQLPKLTTSGLFPRAKSNNCLLSCPSVETSLQLGAGKPSRAVLFNSVSSNFTTVRSIFQLHQDCQKFSYGTSKCCSLYLLIFSLIIGTEEAIRIKPIARVVRRTVNGHMRAYDSADSIVARGVYRSKSSSLVDEVRRI